MVKGQSETLAHTLTMGLQQGSTPKQMFSSQHIAKISVNESNFTYFGSYRTLLLNSCMLSDNLWFVFIT